MLKNSLIINNNNTRIIPKSTKLKLTYFTLFLIIFWISFPYNRPTVIP
jgi:hypothetical protein